MNPSSSGAGPRRPAYVELHCHSNFSLLDGASHPEALVAQAAALEMPALALTDHDAVYGAVRFLQAAREQGVRPILGAELTVADVSRPGLHHHLTLLVENQAGWHNLCYLISRARHQAAKGQAVLPFAEITGCTTGLIALSGCPQGEVARAVTQRNVNKAAVAAARRYLDLFGRDNFYIELQRHFLPGEHLRLPRLVALAGHLQLGCVVTNNVHYATPDQHRLQDVLVCIGHRTTLDQATHLRRPNSEYYLKPAGQMAALFPGQPQALANSLHLAERCHFELDYGLQDLPPFPTPHGMSSSAYLSRLCQAAIPQRYPDPPSRLHEQLAHELQVIAQAGLANYFLIVWDLVRFAREQQIRCQGRGSAANSLVAYLLHISPIDPLAHDLVFERFLSAERQVVPDIDIDFDAQRREEVIQYVYERYGADHTAMACTFVTFRARSAVRDIGQALGLAPPVIAGAVQLLADAPAGDLPPQAAPDPAGHDPLPLLLDLARQIDGFPRHLGIHSGGMIITGAPLMGRVPTEPATMPGRVVVQWDKEALEAVGLVKIDILGLRMLSAISDTLALLAANGPPPDLDALSFTDPAVYQMIAAADTIGVFQVESRAQAQMLPRLQPRSFADLVVAISLIRPGPIQGNMVHPYLRRRQGVEPVSYLHPLLAPALRETLGVILFQEQVLKVARDVAGFTPGQGELLRRALGAKRPGAALAAFQAQFVAGAAARGVPAGVAEALFDQLRAFGGYAFAKSHAAAFAVLVYQSAWLKHYHFAAFYTALLNNQPMGFWNAAILSNELRRHGVPLLPPDIAHSQPQCSLENGQVRLGFNYVRQLREGDGAAIVAARQDQPFADLADFCRRTRLTRPGVENLIMAGAMDRWGVPRRELLWTLGTLHDLPAGLGLDFAPQAVTLPPLSPAAAMLAEQAVLGLSPGDHLLSFYRAALQAQGILGSQALGQCADGQRVRVAGLLVVHQSPPTARGHHFLTLEDEDGMMNVIARPGVFQQYGSVVRGHLLLLVGGQVQRQGEVVNLLADWLAPLGSQPAVSFSR